MTLTSRMRALGGGADPHRRDIHARRAPYRVGRCIAVSARYGLRWTVQSDIQRHHAMGVLRHSAVTLIRTLLRRALATGQSWAADATAC